MGSALSSQASSRNPSPAFRSPTRAPTPRFTVEKPTMAEIRRQSEDVISISSGTPSPSPPRKPTSPSPSFYLARSPLRETNLPPPRLYLASLSPMARVRLEIAAANEETRNTSRAHRRPLTIEPPEAESNGCHCRYGHKDFETCSSDPKSPYFSPGPGEQAPAPKRGNRTMEKKQKAPARTAKKRKAEPLFEKEVKYECECGGGHDSDTECEYATTLKKHIEISTSVIIGSQAMVTIIAGTEPKQSFLVHKELLALYSGYFQDVFSGRNKVEIREEAKTQVKMQLKPQIKQEFEQPPVSQTPESSASGSTGPDRARNAATSSSSRSLPGSDNRSISPTISQGTAMSSLWESVETNQMIGSSLPRPRRPTLVEGPNSYSLPDINPSQFAQFISFLYAGRIIDAFEPLIVTIEHNSVEALWYFGQTLRSPSFQNNILESLRTSAAVKSGTWPSPEDIEIVYDLHKEHNSSTGNDSENMLKKFCTHCLGANNPFERYKDTSSQGLAWQELLRKRNDIIFDVLKAGGVRWALTKPWDDKLRGDYMVEEEEIEEVWERMILARRGKDSVMEAAKAGEVGAKLEMGHLAAEEKRLGYSRWGYVLADDEDSE